MGGKYLSTICILVLSYIEFVWPGNINAEELADFGSGSPTPVTTPRGPPSTNLVRTFGIKQVIDKVETLSSIVEELHRRIAVMEAAEEERKSYTVAKIGYEVGNLKARLDRVETSRDEEKQVRKELDERVGSLETAGNSTKLQFINFERKVLERNQIVQTELIDHKTWTAAIFNDYCKIMLMPNDENKIYALTEVYDFCVQKVNYSLAKDVRAINPRESKIE